MNCRDDETPCAWTWLAIGIAVVVLWMATAVLLLAFALPGSGHSLEERAVTEMLAVRSGVELHLAQDPASSCPSIKDLTREGILSAARTTQDPWGRPFDIRCSGDVIAVRSAGRDGVLFTPDDVVL